MKTRGKIPRGKTNKRKAMQQQEDIYNKGGTRLRDFSNANM